MNTQTIHLATGDFCYVETLFEGTVEEAIAEAKRLQNLKDSPGVSGAEWRILLDSIMKMEKRTEPVPTERLNKEQLFCLREVRNYLVRNKQ